MKRILFHTLLSLTLCLLSLEGIAQSGIYGNEWIDYSKTYYKFKVGKSGVFRITRATLDAAGLPASVTGNNFMLFRDGLEVPIYVSAITMAGTDYIEFVGHAADGTLDKELYDNPAWQPDTRICLYTDTASYFLTYDNNSGHSRLNNTPNIIPATPPTPEAYNWATVGNYYKNAITPGQSYDTSGTGGLEFYSPSFDNGEGFVNALVSNNSATSITLNTPNIVAASVNASLRTSVTSRSFHLQHQMSVAVNNGQVATGNWGTAETKHFTPTLPASQLTASNTITYTPVSNPNAVFYDAYGVSYAELEYPRNYDMTGLSVHSFRLNASGSPQYLEFTNFSAAARLYDTINKKSYIGDVLNGKVRFYLPPSGTDRQLTLVATNNPTGTLSVAKTIHFTDYTPLAGNDGDYVIITHKQLMAAAGGFPDIIQEYKNYRSLGIGGSHKVSVADVTELYDQFGYGYETHPMSIRHFLQYAYSKWTTKPAIVNIIGHGLQYDSYNNYFANPSVYNFPIVPVYGSPGSDVDFVNFGTPRTQKMQVGRVSVWNANEVADYLSKVKVYEAALNTGNTADALWKKRVMHLAGGIDDSQAQQLLGTLNAGKTIIEDTLVGAHVNTFSKGTTNTPPIISQTVDSLINSGQSMVTYFGHAAANILGFNLPDPNTYHASPRFPVFTALGCDVAQMFVVGQLAAANKSLSESYTLSLNGGAITLLATDNYGYTGFLDNYLYEYYYSTAYRDFGSTVGLHIMNTNNVMLNAYQANADWRFYFTQIECQILTGDPGVATFGPQKPDYHVANNALSAIPGNVSSLTDSFQLRITAYNLGRAIYDTVQVKVDHTNPAGSISPIGTFNLVNLLNTDTLYVWVKVNKLTDLGLNKYHVTIDPLNKFDESDETNNGAEFQQFIYSDDLIPVYPHEFAIVHKQGVTLKASTLNPFRPSARYIIEIDTTTDFNSPQKLQTVITSPGGLIKWTPSLVMKDSTVYYWRTAFDSTINGQQNWAVSSFVYLVKGSDGWNQSHYFQYKRDGYTDMDIKSDRQFKYNIQSNVLEINNKVLRANNEGGSVLIKWNTATIQRGPIGATTLQVMVIDSLTAKFWKNSVGDLRGAAPPIDATRGAYIRDFDMTLPAKRDSARKYIESVPDGDYIMVRNNFLDFYDGSVRSQPIYVNQWKADATLPGVGLGHTLYDAIYNLGFTKIDSFQKEGAFIFMKKKGAPTNMTEQWTGDSTVALQFITTIDGFGTSGNANSTVIGPASQWTNLKWKAHPSDNLAADDHAYVSVRGITNSGIDTLLFNTRNIDSVTNFIDTSLSLISATTYPKLRLVWHTLDSLASTAPQLDYWRVLYTPIPEAALNPSSFYTFSDSLQTGQIENFGVAIENLTDIDFRDSMLVTYKVINANGVSSLLSNTRYKKLLASDTLHAVLSFNPSAFPGRNNLFVEANPNNDQPEQYHPNNLGYLPFNIGVDKNNPLLDVTFDGVHILNRDIVSAKPFIKISLKDDNKYLALDDTSLVTITLKKTGEKGDMIPRIIDLPFNGTTCKFIPGQTGADNKNTAVIEIRPELDDDFYVLEVKGKDKSNNLAGTPQGSSPTGAKYTVEFEIINKATVTNVLNYPNPFSTATSFLFTITGSQLPSQFKIQILSVTGKVVREITKNELGPLHIGRNITEYKWDGKDQYGQMLGNGVYMYRVATSLNGEQIEHRDGGGDRFFKNGYGKMYIMR